MDTARLESDETEAAEKYHAALDALRDAFENALAARERCHASRDCDGTQNGQYFVSKVEAAWGSDTFEYVVIQALNKWPRR